MLLREIEICTLFDARNAPEIARRREQWQSLPIEEREGSFEAFLDRYGHITRMGERSDQTGLMRLGVYAALKLPDELIEFYLRIGKLESGGPHGPVDVFSVHKLLAQLEMSVEESPSSRLKSMGLLDLVNRVWGNGRFELDPANGCIELDALNHINANYRGIGWVWVEPGLEAHEFIYFDTEGRFGTVFYHQDDFEMFHDEELLPMLTRSPAHRTLSDIILSARCDMWEDEDEDEA
ncbi:MAG: hypothetical protein JNM76_02575 [Betaproteobacteria bacterium]|nr:hypothetical protein [Betaproteobacteria bacterium]